MKNNKKKTIGKNNGKSSFTEDLLPEKYLKKTVLEKFSSFKHLYQYFYENKKEIDN